MKLDELINKCNELQLNPTPTKKRRNPDRMELSKKDCLKVIQEYYIDKLKCSGEYTTALDLLLSIPSLMLATNFVHIKDEYLKRDLWEENNDWIFQEKVDGIRVFVVYIKEDKDFQIYGRDLDPVTCLPINYTKVLGKQEYAKIITKDTPSFILDCDVIYKSSADRSIHDILTPYNTNNLGNIMFSNAWEDKIKYYLIDCIYIENDFTINKPLRERLINLFDIQNKLTGEFSNLRITRNEKDKLYKDIQAEQGDGVVAKDLDSFYEILGKRSLSWIRLRNDNLQNTIKQPITFYAYVVGHSILPNVLYFSTLIKPKNEQVSFTLSNISDGIMNIYLQDFVGMALCECLGITPQGVLIAPRFLCWEYNKEVKDCILKINK